MGDNTLIIKDLFYSYPDGHSALNGVSLSLNRGEKVALIGANGSGKSTLLLHIAGVLAPQRGEIFFNENIINAKNLDILKKNVGLIFQEPDDQLFMPDVLEDVSFGLVAQNINIEEAKTQALKILEELEISHLANRPPHKLSGGEKRMVTLAGILIMQPEILALDEPTAALDPKARRRVINILNSLKNKTLLLATHDLDMALDVCQRAVILHKGRVAASGKLPELLRDEKLLNKNGLELPLRYHNLI